MEAVILAGGKGTRLKPYTVTLPKPLVPVGEKPILDIVINQLKKAGVTKITIAVNHMADIIMAFFGNGEKYGIDISYSFEDKPLSTVAPIKLIEGLPENFLVMNGDILTDINYTDLFQSHLNSGADLTIATYKREAKIDFGVLDINEQKKEIIGFREKPKYHFSVSMGVYVFSRSVLDQVPYYEAYGLDNLVLDMLKSKKKINSYLFDGYWLDIGRPDDYEQANTDIENRSF
ncbi:nucleotidyltransferase family protein [Sporomusa acidovorans]|uniref:D-glycero-alpha-D-manno-heptose 1-phosphate guanylyltransferase n=1 Tax=Sporomusa acidovorans (strain ATCC 49682 / DSM 3132 / Mol) TaxID=1123286 RepID=A0ABZ3J6X5_SPOA4|nr:sugar phosphate nucleotidyltransferase [Sporomusa acidovorans]OZC19341.1 D-glycero-alpha-D-manno-heptose 1-phosphate guanylyltransferase [Sporomusa acidovorans DSM 3132]SDD80264.1 Nucleotidyl transferase [Sporomusa acidovorans]